MPNCYLFCYQQLYTVCSTTTMPRRCVLETILVTGQLLLSERFSWKIGLWTPFWLLWNRKGRVNNNKISNYLARTNYRLDVRLGFPDYVTAYAPHNLQGRLERFSRSFFVHACWVRSERNLNDRVFQKCSKSYYNRYMWEQPTSQQRHVP